VLVHSTVDTGASNRPDVTATAASHGDTASTPHRRAIAPATATIAATASATSDPVAAGSNGSASKHAQQSGERLPQRPRPHPKPTQPTPHRRRRPTQPLSHPPMPPPSRSPHQRHADHRDRVRPPHQHSDRQQHMRGPTASAAGPARSKPPPDLPTVANHPRPAMPPRAQPAPASRAHQPAPRQSPLDAVPVLAYREHRCLHAPHRGPPGRSAKRRPGGPLAYPNPLTLSSHTNKRNPATTSRRDTHTQRRGPTPTRSPRTTGNNRQALTGHNRRISLTQRIAARS
jgi:hypothetical protein